MLLASYYIRAININLSYSLYNSIIVTFQYYGSIRETRLSIFLLVLIRVKKVAKFKDSKMKINACSGQVTIITSM